MGEITIFLKSINEYMVLVIPITTALSSVYIIYIGIRRIFREKNKHEKFLILHTKEINTSDGKETYILTENDHIKKLIEENERLKNENNILEGKYNKLSFVVGLATVLILLPKFLLQKLSKKENK